MIRFIFSVIILGYPLISMGQESFFLDSLFQYDFSGYRQLKENSFPLEREIINQDIGLSAGLGYTNVGVNNLGAGPALRLTGKMDLLKSGWKERNFMRQLQDNERLIDSLSNYPGMQQTNYSFYYDYIIYLFNQEKIKIATQISEQSQEHQKRLEKLYYHKAVAYDKILDVRRIIQEYSLMKNSMQMYNQQFDRFLTDDALAQNLPQQEVKIDFDALFTDIAIDSTSHWLKAVMLENTKLEQDRLNLPSLSVTAGYDFLRTDPYVSISLSKRLFTKPKTHYTIQAQEIDFHMQQQQFNQQKEMLNVMYEFDYKHKQIKNLKNDHTKVHQVLQDHKAKQAILSLPENLENYRLEIDSLRIQFEIVDLQQQQMLLLLQLKKILPLQFSLGDYILSSPESSRKKHLAARFLYVPDSTINLDVADELYLKENEIQQITATDLFQLKSYAVIYPSDYDTRWELEQYLQLLHDDQGVDQFVFIGIEGLKNLDENALRARLLANNTVLNN